MIFLDLLIWLVFKIIFSDLLIWVAFKIIFLDLLIWVAFKKSWLVNVENSYQKYLSSSFG